MCCRKMCPWLGNFWNYYSEMSLSAHLKASSLFSDRINIAIIISDAEPFPFVIWPLLPQIHYIIPLAACNRSATGARGKLSSCTLSLPWCCGFIRKFLSLRLREYKKKKRAWPPFFYSVSFPASRFFTGSAAYLNSICPAKKFSAARRHHQFQKPSGFFMLPYIEYTYRLCSRSQKQNASISFTALRSNPSGIETCCDQK